MNACHLLNSQSYRCIINKKVQMHKHQALFFFSLGFELCANTALNLSKCFFENQFELVCLERWQYVICISICAVRKDKVSLSQKLKHSLMQNETKKQNINKKKKESTIFQKKKFAIMFFVLYYLPQRPLSRLLLRLRLKLCDKPLS